MNEDLHFIHEIQARRVSTAAEIYTMMILRRNAKKEMPFDGEIEDDGFITAYSSVPV